jgi:uncharacterized protein YndB with AHSA1/START domain
MSNRSATHSTFVIERNYDASPARVFAAWADANSKGQWFGGGGEQQHELDFREGGREHFEASVEGAVYSCEHQNPCGCPPWKTASMLLPSGSSTYAA